MIIFVLESPRRPATTSYNIHPFGFSKRRVKETPPYGNVLIVIERTVLPAFQWPSSVSSYDSEDYKANVFDIMPTCQSHLRCIDSDDAEYKRTGESHHRAELRYEVGEQLRPIQLFIRSMWALVEWRVRSCSAVHSNEKCEVRRSLDFAATKC